MELIETYNLMLEKTQKEYREKNPKLDNRYRASSSGMCARKIYFEAIEKAEVTNPADSKSARIMRLGTIVHEDIQKMLVKAIKEE
tara:strand:- start:639 stop:893 length:255 start_codon:yes stop_codon:yes gene_type:complete